MMSENPTLLLYFFTFYPKSFLKCKGIYMLCINISSNWQNIIHISLKPKFWKCSLILRKKNCADFSIYCIVQTAKNCLFSGVYTLLIWARLLSPLRKSALTNQQNEYSFGYFVVVISCHICISKIVRNLGWICHSNFH